MDDKQNTSDSNVKKEPSVIRQVNHPDEVIKNPNRKANENIRVGTEEAKPQNTKPGYSIGSEISDGEDG